MKRLLAIIAAAAVTGSGAFALDLGVEGLTLTGEVYTGASIATEYAGHFSGSELVNDEYQTRVFAHNDTYDGSYSARITAKYDVDAGGLAIRLGGTMSLGDWFGYGWLNFLGGKDDAKIVLYGGIIDGNLWGTTSGNILDTGSDAVGGLRLAIKPIEGLSFGVAVPFTGTQFNFWDDSNLAGDKIGDTVGDLVIGVGYEKKDSFKVHFTADLIPAVPDSTNPTENEYDSSVALLFSATVNPMKALALDVDFLFRTEKSAKGYNNHGNNLVGYKGFDSGIQATFAVSEALSVWGRIKPLYGEGGQLHDAKVETADSEFALGLYLGLKYKLSAIEPFLELGSHNLLFLDGNGLYAKVGLNVPLTEDGNFAFQAYDKISGIGAKGDNVIANLVQINLDWKF